MKKRRNKSGQHPSHRPPSRTLVLGLGNELYGDDGVGIHAVRLLKETLHRHREKCEWLDGVDLEECSVSGLALLDYITGYDRLIIIDTIKKESPQVGRVSILEACDLRSIPGPSPHYVSIPQTLELGSRIGVEVPSEIKIIAVEAKHIYTLGEKMTDEMAAQLPLIIQAVEDFLKNGEHIKKWKKKSSLS